MLETDNRSLLETAYLLQLTPAIRAQDTLKEWFIWFASGKVWITPDFLTSPPPSIFGLGWVIQGLSGCKNPFKRPKTAQKGPKKRSPYLIIPLSLEMDQKGFERVHTHITSWCISCLTVTSNIGICLSFSYNWTIFIRCISIRKKNKNRR